MERVLVAGVLLTGAVALALVLRRRAPHEPVRTSWAVPTWVDRADFAAPGTPWLVAVFTASSCRSCQDTLHKARPLGGAEVVVEEVEVGVRPELHDRYGIEAVPTVLIVDAEGAVRGSFLGPPTTAELWARVAEAREDGFDPGPAPGSPAG